MTDLTVKDFMQSNPPSVTVTTSLVETVELLLNRQLTALPVVGDTNEVVGIISEYDCHKAMLMSSYHCDTPVYVKDILNTAVTNVHVEEGIADVAIKLSEQTSSVYPVLSNNKLVGLLTRSDILQALNENLSLCTSTANHA